MEKYIPLDALLAEIEKLMNCYDSEYDKDSTEVKAAKGNVCHEILCIIDSLEVKEVDLEKEYKDFIKCDNGRSMFETAKHFFELGLKTRIDKELVEELHSHIDSIKDTADRMTSGNFMHNRAAIKFSANTIAKVLELIGLKA